MVGAAVQHLTHEEGEERGIAAGPQGHVHVGVVRGLARARVGDDDAGALRADALQADDRVGEARAVPVRHHRVLADIEDEIGRLDVRDRLRGQSRAELAEHERGHDEATGRVDAERAVHLAGPEGAHEGHRGHRAAGVEAPPRRPVDPDRMRSVGVDRPAQAGGDPIEHRRPLDAGQVCVGAGRERVVEAVGVVVERDPRPTLRARVPAGSDGRDRR